MSLPLDGIRVIDLSRLLPGPFATQILADFGAEVIKVEDTSTGDGFRTAEPLVNGTSLRHVTLNRNKRCLALDLKHPDGKEVFRRLVASADVLLEQFRPGVMERLGFSYEAAKAINPRLVYCSLSGFGQSGPLRDLPAHDPNYLSLAGILSLIGPRDGPPALSGWQIADITTALFAVNGILIALRRAEREGHGDHVDVTLFDGVLAGAVTAVTRYLASGEAPTRGDERHTGRYPMADIYETADGGHVTLAAIEPHFWANLCRALGHPEWIGQQYATGEAAETIRAEMRSIFRSRSRDAWFEELKDKNVCIAPVLDLGEALASAQARHREVLVEHEHPTVGATSVLATPIRMKEAGPTIRTPAGDLGEHTREILAELDFTEDAVERFLAAGAIATGTGRTG